MSYAPVLPSPLRHKIAGWNLPVLIELELLEQLGRHIEQLPAEPGRCSRYFEFYATENNHEYGFCVRYTAKASGNDLVLLDMDIDSLEDWSHEPGCA
jgi:hypothetical protein